MFQNAAKYQYKSLCSVFLSFYSSLKGLLILYYLIESAPPTDVWKLHWESERDQTINGFANTILQRKAWKCNISCFSLIAPF